MKKAIMIVVLGLLLTPNISLAGSGLYKECFIKEVTLPELKVYERKSFNEMKDFPDPKNLLKYSNKFYLSRVNLLLKETKAFKEIRFEAIGSEYSYSKFKVVAESKNNSIYLEDFLYTASIVAEDYIEYKQKYGNSIIIHLKDDILELKSKILLHDPSLDKYIVKESFSIFLKCKFEPYKKINKIKKKKTNKIMGSYDYYLILLGIISLINLIGIIYLIKRKK